MAKIIVDIDTINMVAFSDSGEILQIEDFLDMDGTPCLPEEAVIANVRASHGSYVEYHFREEN